MAEIIWNGIVESRSNAGADQRVTLRVKPGTPRINKGDAIKLSRGTPDAPPPPPSGVSPSGTVIPPATQIVTPGGVWTIEAGTNRLLLDGAHVGGGLAQILLWFNDVLYASRTDLGAWYSFTGSAWIQISGDPRPAPGPTPTPPIATLTLASTQTDGQCTVSTVGTAAQGSASLQTWELAWGDGQKNSGSGAPPILLAHQYATGGTRLITLTVQDSNGMAHSANLSASIVVNPPTPLPVPVPPPVPPPPPGPRAFLGGWRIAFDEFPQGAIAMDFSQNTLWAVANGRVYRYALPAYSTNLDKDTWARQQPVQIIAPWWPGTQAGANNVYVNGLAFFRGKLWVALRFFYAVDPAATLPLTLYAQDGETITIPSLTTQKFSGFVKRGPGMDPYVGCGGYESGQGSQSGPSLARLDGTKLIEYQWPGLPGPLINGVPEFWNQRAPRDTNYRAMDGNPPFPSESWVAWDPRTINGVLEARWASDVIFGGGLALPEGITYWPRIGTGDLYYARQTLCFAADGLVQTYQYLYDPATFAFTSFTPFDVPGGDAVYGQELGPDGKVYLNMLAPWFLTDPAALFDCALKVYG